MKFFKSFGEVSDTQVTYLCVGEGEGLKVRVLLQSLDYESQSLIADSVIREIEKEKVTVTLKVVT